MRTSNHAVIVSASKYWFNYRHNSNALSIYRVLKYKGFRDDNIILMLADDFVSNARNPAKNEIYIKPGISNPLQSNDSIFDVLNTEVDYRGEDVTVQNFINVLSGRQNSGLPVLNTDQGSNILIYLTGHGGDEFFKFQDVEEILAEQLANTIAQMNAESLYREILFIADTCQAFTLGQKLGYVTPNVTFIGSSLKGQSSYAHHSDSCLGLSIVEKYTYYFVEHLRKHDPELKGTIKENMIDSYTYEQQQANIGVSDNTSVRKIQNVLLGDFLLSIDVVKGKKEKVDAMVALNRMRQYIRFYTKSNIRRDYIAALEPRKTTSSFSIDFQYDSTRENLDPTFLLFIASIFLSLLTLGSKEKRWRCVSTS